MDDEILVLLAAACHSQMKILEKFIASHRSTGKSQSCGKKKRCCGGRCNK